MRYDENCVFCKVAAEKVPATIVHADDEIVAFRDINPQAPTHVLVIPRDHIPSAAEVEESDDHLWGRMLRVARTIAADDGHAQGGYRLVTNVGRMSGQTVFHLHLHVLAGRRMTWPPG